jgi:type IV pilus assembly protein PilM
MKLAHLLKDPPPTHAFELSEEGLALAAISEPARAQFAPLEAGALLVSPVHDNVQQPHALLECIHALAPATGQRKRGAALILPDYSARIAVLDFDAFPSQPQEQLALVRFRMKKSVPFDIDAAVVGFTVQARGADGKVDVLAAVIAAPVVAQYEAPFQAAGFHPGFVTTSSLAALNLIEADRVNMLVKRSGRILSVLVLNGSTIKLARCMEMEDGSEEELDSVLHPTIAYIEDELKTRPQRVWLGGFGSETPELAGRWEAEWGVPVEPLRARFGAPDQSNVGLFGYLESVAA